MGIFDRSTFHSLWMATCAVVIAHISLSTDVGSRYGIIEPSGPPAGFRVRKSSGNWKALYVVLHVPFLVYLCYALAFRLELPYWLHWMSSIVEFVLLLIGWGVYAVSVIGVTLLVTLSLFLLCSGGISLLIYLCEPLTARWRRVPRDHISDNLSSVFESIGIGILVSLGGLLLLWLGLGAYTYNSKLLTGWRDYGYVLYTPLFGNSTVSNLVDSGFTNSISGIWMIILLFVLISVFRGVFLSGGAKARNRVSWGNFLVTLLVFLYYLTAYDPQGSNKPAWTEWLG